MADDHVYRVTYRSGRVATCNRRSLAGKVGLMHSEQHGYELVYDDRGRWIGSRKVTKQAHAVHDIIKVERAPIGGWDDVTQEFL